VCPAIGCGALFAVAVLEEALAGSPRELALLHDLLAEALVEHKLYCPYEGCAALLDAGALGGLLTAECLSCHRLICVPCKAAYHAGRSCEEYQAMPAILRGNASERALHALAADAGWRACPSCGTMVEREPHGCNFLMCRCRSAFCFRCGAAYLHLRPTAANAHGQPGCNCGLFEAVVEDEAALARRRQREQEDREALLRAQAARLEQARLERQQAAQAAAQACAAAAAVAQRQPYAPAIEEADQEMTLRSRLERSRAEARAALAERRPDAVEAQRPAPPRQLPGIPVRRAAAAPPAAQAPRAAQRGRAVELRERFVRKPGAAGAGRWEMSPAGPRFCLNSRTHAGCRYGRRCWHLHVDENPQ